MTVHALNGCDRCTELMALIAGYERSMAELGERLQRAEDELAGRERQLRREGATVTALKRELRKSREEEPDAEVIEGLLSVWMRATGRETRRGRKPDLAIGGKRAEYVRAALRKVNKRTRQRYTPEDLTLAFTGLGLMPFAGKTGRTPTAVAGGCRYDEVEHAMRDEPTIDRFIGYAERAIKSAAGQRDAMWRAWRQHAAQEALYGRLVLDACAAVERGWEGEDLEGFLRASLLAGDREWSGIVSDFEAQVAARQPAQIELAA